MPAPARARVHSQARALFPAQAPATERTKTTMRRVMVKPRAMVVVLMLVAEMVMARVVVEMRVAESQMKWRDGR
jgi:type VI protein secretion system component VasF